MKCPHCQIAFNEQQTRTEFDLFTDEQGHWLIERDTCPECKKFVLTLLLLQKNKYGNEQLVRSRIVHPKANVRKCPKEVTDVYSSDFNESALVLVDSPKASAALSRRCLQNLLREQVKTQAKDLAAQIQEVIDGNLLPSYLQEDLDAVRNIGNFAAHPMKSLQTGEVIDVEPEEASWNLDVLEALFEYLFVQPKKNEARKKALNEKLKAAGKPEIQ